MRSACGGLVAPRPHAASLRKRALYSTSASLPAGRLREREQSSCNAHDFARMGPNGTRGFEPTPHPCTRPAGGVSTHSPLPTALSSYPKRQNRRVIAVSGLCLLATCAAYWNDRLLHRFF